MEKTKLAADHGGGVVVVFALDTVLFVLHRYESVRALIKADSNSFGRPGLLLPSAAQDLSLAARASLPHARAQITRRKNTLAKCPITKVNTLKMPVVLNHSSRSLALSCLVPQEFHGDPSPFSSA